MVKLIASLTLVAACLSACAHGPGVPSGPPSLRENTGRPAPSQARLYGDCIASAVAAGSFDREDVLNVVRFRCEGGPAQAFFEGLGPWSAKIGSEMAGEGRTWRFGSKLERDPVGVDFCSVGAAGDDWRCTVVLNVGEFLSFQP